MPVSRPLLIALVAAVVALVAFYAVQAMGGPDTDPAVDAPIPATPVETTTATEAAERSDDARPAGERRTEAARRGMPASLARALRRGRIVVLYFRGSPSADDRATARAVAGLRARPGVSVFVDRIGRIGRYRAVVGGLGISQAPAVVIVDRRRAARVVQGYIDPETLAQDVADAR